MRLGVSKKKIASESKTENTSDDIEVLVMPNEARNKVAQHIITLMKPEVVNQLERVDLFAQILEEISSYADIEKIQINRKQQEQLADEISDELVGLGPLEPLLRDPEVTEVMINGRDDVFIERSGRLFKSKTTFRSEEQLLNVAKRIARDVGRRIDESSPLVDARLADGSRVNIVIPPIALDGTSISIRKFPDQDWNLTKLMQFGSMSTQMRDFLELSSKAKLNILVSGGTSSGKTSLLNALSHGINESERIITIEDSAELKLGQPHVVRLETRPAPPDKPGSEIDQSALVKNALRMRPDRIIVGEVRGEEAWSLLNAMNTGHDGSFGTIHANTTRDALGRLENLVLMAGFELPSKAIKNQISSALHLVIQAERMIDGRRRITQISEVTGMEGDIISMQDLFSYETTISGEGEFEASQATLTKKTMVMFEKAGLGDQVRRVMRNNN